LIDPSNPNYRNKPGSSQRPNFDYILSEDDFIPYVSIITPFYNTDEVFYDTAKSVLNQSFQQFEWLIINDGTVNQSSIEILHKFRDKDRRIKIVDHDSNKGLSAARNTGFKLAKAKYVLQIDSDDLLEETALEKWLWFLESYPEHSFCKGFSIGFGAEEYLWDNGFIDGRSFLFQNLTDSTCLIKKSVHGRVGGYDENLKEGLEDWDFWLKCANSGFWGSNIPEYLNWYRRRKDHSDKWEKFDSSVKDGDIMRRFRENYPELWNGYFPNTLAIENVSSSISLKISNFKNILKKKKQRVIILLSSLDNDFEYRISFNFINQLIREDCEISVVTIGISNNNRLSEISDLTPDVFVSPNFLKMQDYHKFLLYILISRQIDIILFFNYSIISSLIPFINQFIPNIKLISLLYYKDINQINAFNKIQQNKKYLDLVLVLDTNTKYIKMSNSTQEGTILCKEIIDTEYWNSNAQHRQEVRNELNINTDDTVLICCFDDMIHKIKPRVLLGTILELAKKIKNLSVIIAGIGINWTWFNDFLIKHDLENRCHRIGVTNDDIFKRLFSAADIFFSPFEIQNEELLILKAMSSNLCVVGTNTNFDYNIIDDKCGRLIKYTNEEDEIKQFTSIIEDLNNNKNLLREVGNQSRAKIKNEYSIVNISNAISDFIKEEFDRTSSLSSNVEVISIDSLYSEINKFNNELSSDIEKNTIKNIFINYESSEDVYNQNQLLYKLSNLNNEFEKMIKYNRELSEGIKFWQTNADTNYKKLNEISNNFFVRILIKLGLMKNIF